MSERWARGALAAYRLAGSVAAPVIGTYVGWRAARGKEDRSRRQERYGLAGIERPPGPLVWMHAASIGESLAVEPLVRAIAAEDISVVMTTGTVTSAGLVGDRLAGERLGGEVIHQYVPLDLKPFVARFLDHWRPDLAITAESEIWPATMLELRRRRVPHLLVNARLSDRSFRRWRAVPSLAEALLENVAHIVAQSAVDSERFHMLGARAVTVAGNLKADIAPPSGDPRELERLGRMIGVRSRWAALSTHEGEEALTTTVHRRIAADRPRLLTIIVPRHVERADAIEKQLRAQGLAVARRSRGEDPDPTIDVFLGDTVGEMGLYLGLTEIAFVGKSIHGEGGQNPLEAAMAGAAIVSGRMVQNFRDVYQRLATGGAARIVPDGESLADEVALLLSDEALRASRIAAARRVVAEMQGSLARTIQALDPFLQPLRLATSFDRREGEGERR